MADAATSASLSGCPSTDSLNDHYSALAERWQNMTTSNCDRDGDDDQSLDPESRASRPPPSTGSSSGPLSPPSPAPDCVADRAAMDATVRTTLKRMEQLSSFLSSSEADDSFHGGGRRGACTSFGSSNVKAASGKKRIMINIPRVGSADGDDDSNSVGSVAEQSTSSLLSDDSLRREESALASGHAVDAMRKEMENLEAEDHRSLLLFLPQIPSISNDDDEDKEKDMCDAAGGTPHREVRMLNPYDASPSGVAEFPSCNTDGDDEDASSSSSSSSPSSASPFTDLLGGDSPFRSASKSLLHKFDSNAARTKRFADDDDDDDDASSCQLAHPEKEVSPSGWINYIAEVAYGSHEYQVKTPTTRLKSLNRTVEGGLLVTASVSVVLAILLRTSDMLAVFDVHVTEPQFYAALAIVPPLISLVQAKVVPHRMDETTVALGVLLGGLLLERGLC